MSRKPAIKMMMAPVRKFPTAKFAAAPKSYTSLAPHRKRTGQYCCHESQGQVAFRLTPFWTHNTVDCLGLPPVYGKERHAPRFSFEQFDRHFDGLAFGKLASASGRFGESAPSGKISRYGEAGILHSGTGGRSRSHHRSHHPHG